MKNQQSSQVATPVAAKVTVAGVEFPAWKAAGLIKLGQRCLEEKRAAKRAIRIAEKERIAAEQAAMRKQLELKEKLQVIAEQCGVDLEQLLAAAKPRANSATPKPSREAIEVDGVLLPPCKAVHAICAKNQGLPRKEVIELCVAAGINKATASTQYQVFHKQ